MFSNISIFSLFSFSINVICCSFPTSLYFSKYSSSNSFSAFFIPPLFASIIIVATKFNKFKSSLLISFFDSSNIPALMFFKYAI